MDERNLLQLGKSSLHSILALVSRTFVLQLIQIAASLIIFSILAPNEVGIYVAVIAIQRIISFFTDFGLGAALIQNKQEVTQNDLKTTFTVQAAVTFGIFLVIFLFSDIISDYFEIGAAGKWLLISLVATIFISSFKIIPSILLERKIQFQKLVIPQVTESLVFNTILILLVIKGFGLSSYSYAFIISSLVTVPLYYYISPWKIEFGIVKSSITHLKFGVQFQAKNILATIKDDFLTVILTKFLSFAEIGFIGFAQRIAFLAYRYVVDSVTKVTFSTYSRIQDNKEILRKATEKSLFFIAALMFPILSGLIIIGPYIISYVPQWSNKWEPAVFSLIFFCLNAAVSSMSGILVNILDATGRVKTTLHLMVIWTILTWTLTPLLIYAMGYNGVAIASFIVTLTIVYTIHLVKKQVQFDFIKSVYKPIICVIVMSIVVYSATQLFVSDIPTLILAIALGVITYIGIFAFFAKEELLSLKNILLRKYEKEE